MNGDRSMFAHPKSGVSPLNLKNIDVYIKRHIRMIDELEEVDADDRVTKAVLLQILAILQISDTPDSPEATKKKISIAMHYIGALPIEQGNFITGVKTVSLSGLYKEDKGFSLTFDKEVYDQLQSDLTKKLIYYPPPLPSEIVPLLTHLCDALIKHNRKPVWEYRYQIDGSGHVLNDMIADWQKEMARPPTDDKESYRDFKRDSKIMGKNKFASDEAVTAAIRQMIVAATGYSTDEKVKLFIWMQEKAGQRINYIFNAMAAHSEFGEWKPAILKAVDINWHVSKEGKIHLNYEVVVSAFGNDKGEFLVGKADGSVITTTNPESLPKLTADEIPPAVLRVNARAELQIEEGEVVPRFSQLHLSGCSEKLTSPSHKYESQVEVHLDDEKERKGMT